MEFLEKEKQSTIEEHIELCDYDPRNFWHNYPYYDVTDDMRKNMNDGFYGIESYYDNTGDEVLLSKKEFASIVAYISVTNNDTKNVKKFINTLKLFNIQEEEILFLMSKYYDNLYFDFPEELDNIKILIDNYRSNEGGKGDKLEELEKYLSIRKEQSNNYKLEQIQRVLNVTSEYSFKGIERYSKELIYLLETLNYNADLLLSNLPDFKLIAKDYERISDSYIPLSINLLKEYLSGDKELSKYPSNLGLYQVHKVGLVPIPYTKEEFISGIHSELEDEYLNNKIKFLRA